MSLPRCNDVAILCCRRASCFQWAHFSLFHLLRRDGRALLWLRRHAVTSDGVRVLWMLRCAGSLVLVVLPPLPPTLGLSLGVCSRGCHCHWGRSYPVRGPDETASSAAGGCTTSATCSPHLGGEGEHSWFEGCRCRGCERATRL